MRSRTASLFLMAIALLVWAGHGAEVSVARARPASPLLLASNLYVDGAGTCGGNSPCFTTIQAAINAATAGDVINVYAGTYAEQITVNKALTILGPNASINPNTGTRVAEAVIIPTASDPINPGFAGPIVVYLSVSGSTFKGFTVDGDNPGLTSGVVYNGADVDAQFGVYGDGSANLDAVIENNIVKNIGDMSVWLNTFGFGGARNGNSRMTANKVDNSLGPFGQGLRISDDAWVDVTNNVVTRVRVGIVIENFSGNVSTHPASVIADNNVTSFRIGIRHNLHYVYSAPGFTIARNTVQAYAQSPMPPQVTTPTAYQGIRVESIQQTVAVTVEDNTVNGNRVAMQTAGYTRDEGLNVTNASATSPNILFRRNNVQNFIRGAYHETPAIPDFECNVFASNTTGVLVDAAANSLIAHNNNIAGNTFGLQNNASGSVNAQANWWGAANGPGPVGPGSGDNVSTNVDFSNWLTAPSSCVNLVTAGQLSISEFRLHGTGGVADEFVEIYNNTDLPHIVTAATGTGYAVAASDGVARCVIPNGTTIPARGHYLCANSSAFSLGGYASGAPATITGVLPEPESPTNLKPLQGKGARGKSPLTPFTKAPAPAPRPVAVVLPPFSTATPDATYTTDIPENAGIALFRTSISADFTLANRLDAVGSTAEGNSLYREGAGLPVITALPLEFSFVRDECGKGASHTAFGLCTNFTPKDTDNNASDFFFVDTNAQNVGAGANLGAPGPQNLASPIQRNAQMPGALLDSTQSHSSTPNRVRDLTPDPVNNSTFGTIDLRRRIVNNTGLPVTRLRFRIIDVTTLPAPSGVADLRARSSLAVVVGGVNDAATCPGGITPCAITVQGTTLEQPPTQPSGGGFNSSLSADVVNLATPLPAGASINVRFLLGVMQPGVFRFYVNIEALP